MSGPTGKRAVLLGVGLLGLLAAVGLASRARAPVGGGGRNRLVGGDILVEYVLLLAAAAAVVVVPVYLYAFIAGRNDEQTLLPPRKNWMLRLLLTMTALSLAAAVFAAVYLARHHGESSPARLQPLTGLADRTARTPHAVRFDWVPVIVVSSLMVAGLGAGVVLLARRRRSAPRAGVAGELALALDEALDDLRSDLDPRATVIAAYAHMERILARHGLARSAPEAPREYLLRVLPAAGAGAGSVERLTTLYERARFSIHTIDAGMKGEAIAAVAFLRDELLGAT